jgi:formylglycine-generating enzyme required for sulfatase activity
MTGNVWEWCWDQDTQYFFRRIRGGCWDTIAAFCPLAHRAIGNNPAKGAHDLGFRVARNVAP